MKMVLANGKYFHYMSPDPQVLDIETVASSLSKICRYFGHCPEFYSVAEHSVHCYRLALEEGLSHAACRAVLMHDAVECLVGDAVRDYKKFCPEHSACEAVMEQVIAHRFGLDFFSFAKEIKRIDVEVLKQEKKFFWPYDKEQWSALEGVSDRRVSIDCYLPAAASRMFLFACKEANII